MIAIHNFSDHYKGDTFSARQINFGFDITDAEIKINFKTTVTSKVAFSWLTSDESIQVITPVSGIINLQAKIIDVAPATYIYDCQITFPNGTVTTYFGGTLTVVQDLTK